ncbi:MAG: hypothetical protein ACPG4X_15830 [Pikeienuella sp.]
MLGAIGYERADGTSCVAVATTADLYTIIGGTVTASSLSFSLSDLEHFNFEQFGSAVYANCKGQGCYRIADMETGTTFVSATPPRANAMARVGDFLVIGDMEDIDASDQPYKIRFSPFNNPEGSWTPDIATQTDGVDLDSGQGKVVSIAGGDYGLVFQLYGISRITYSGGGATFVKENFEKNRGCAAPLSVVRVGNLTYFLSHDGFSVTDGASVSTVSRGRIWDWFKKSVNSASYHRISGAIDWPRRCVVWTFPSAGAEVLDKQLYYNWETQDWSYTENKVDHFVSAKRADLTLEEVAAIYPDLDAMTLSLDSPAFKAEGRALSCFSGGKLATVDGPSLEACFDTGDFQPVIGRRTYVDEITPLISEDTLGITGSIGTRERATTVPTFSPNTAQGPLGYIPVSVDGRYLRVRLVIPAGLTWSDAYGFQAHYQPSGRF